jgi:hypothetical protein
MPEHKLNKKEQREHIAEAARISGLNFNRYFGAVDSILPKESPVTLSVLVQACAQIAADRAARGENYARLGHGE